jgi:hypothetical protein
VPVLPVAIGFGWVLRTIAIPLVLMVLASLGIGFVVYTGMDLLLGAIETNIKAQFDNPAFQSSVDLLVYMNMDDAVSIILSAISVRMAIIGFNIGGTFKTFRLFTGTL